MKRQRIDKKKRCRWVTGGDADYIRYHDREWGRPVHDDRLLFEMLILEGAQAGLSWLTILRKRANYQKAFARFDPNKVARFDAARKAALLLNPGIVRNRLKIDSTVSNARAFLAVQREFGSFDRYLWSFVQRPTGRQSLADRQRAAGAHRAERSHLEGSQEARLPVRRHHDHLRLSAGGRRGQRPHAGLFPVRRRAPGAPRRR